MKIIYITHWRIPSNKTMSPLIMKTCDYLSRQGMEVELWAPARYNSEFRKVDPFVYHGVRRSFTIKRIPVLDLMAVFKTSGFIFMVVSYALAIAFKAFFETGRGTIYFAHDIRDVIFLSLFKRNPVVVEIHDFYKSKIQSLNYLVFPRMRGFVVTNRIKIRVFERDYGMDRKNMIHLPNAVDVEQFDIDLTKREARNKLSILVDAKVILYTGHLFAWKGVDTLLKAADVLEKELPNSRVYFVGGTKQDTEKFRKKAESAHNVFIVGHKPHAEIPLWQRAADVLVLPNTAREAVSKYETSPVKLFEYMASGTPIVASNLPSIRDIVDASSVFFFTPDDPASLARTILTAFSDRTEALKRAQHGRKKATQFSWEKRTEALLQFIQDLMRR